MTPLLLSLCLAQAPLPPLEELVREALRNQSRSFENLTEYTYDYRRVLREFDEKGKLRKETVSTGESYQSARRTVDVEFALNGKPHSRRGVEKRRKEAAWQLQQDYEWRRKLGPAGEGREFGADVDGVRMETFAVLRQCPLSNLRHDTVDGRAAYAIDFGPAPASATFRRAGMEHLKRSRGTVWIDAEDRTASYWKASLVDGPQFFEQRFQRLEPKVWGIRTLLISPRIVGLARREWIVEQTNPKRFTVSVEQTIGEPQKKD